MKSYHPVFGNKKPNYKEHFLNRYVQRFYNISEETTKSWIKFNYKKITSEITERLYNSQQISTCGEQYEYLLRKYGKDVILLQQGKAIFVIRDYINIVTVYKGEAK